MPEWSSDPPGSNRSPTENLWRPTVPTAFAVSSSRDVTNNTAARSAVRRSVGNRREEFGACQ